QPRLVELPGHVDQLSQVGEFSRSQKLRQQRGIVTCAFNCQQQEPRDRQPVFVVPQLGEYFAGQPHLCLLCFGKKARRRLRQGQRGRLSQGDDRIVRKREKRRAQDTNEGHFVVDVVQVLAQVDN